MEKSIYVLSGYIPSDEYGVVISIYHLVSIGRKNIKYFWCDISRGSGIGFKTDEAGYESSEDALIGINGFTDEDVKFMKGTFEEMISEYKCMKNRLNAKLEAQQNIKSK